MTVSPAWSLLQGIERCTIQGRPPSLPAGARIYAFGDIHGRIDLLDRLLEWIEQNMSSHPSSRPVFVFLGDYIDRGPASRETIDRLVRLAETKETVFLKGNHESLALESLTDRNRFSYWMRLGGLDTLASYGVNPKHFSGESRIAKLQAAFHDALPLVHLRFFRDLQVSFTCGDFFFAHAGVKPGLALSRQKERDLLWIRDEFLSSKLDFGKIIVHGHTPVPEVEVEANRINIDTGAFATGRLTCLVIEGASASVIDTLS